jgi:hypothetical protein
MLAAAAWLADFEAVEVVPVEHPGSPVTKSAAAQTNAIFRTIYLPVY